MKKIIFGCDHNGFVLKEGLMVFTKNLGYNVTDCLAENYVDLTRKVVDQIGANEGAMGVLICGSGFGMCMAANRYPKIRAAVCRNWEDAEFCRRQNDANVICFGSEFTPLNRAMECLQHFIERPFKKERHQEHVNKLLKIS